MGRFPVYQSPVIDQAEKRLRELSGHERGFLGHDRRPLLRILEEDDLLVRSLGLNHEDIAARLAEIGEAAREAWGDPILLEQKFLVELHEARGKTPCPWPHPGLYRKNHIVLKHAGTGEELFWSDLAVHMIREHGFYQGEGSPYRLDPARVKRILDLS